MSPRQWRLFFALLALGLIGLWGVLSSPDGSTERSAAERVLAHLSPEAQSLSLLSNSSEITMTKEPESGLWYLSDPLGARVEKRRVEAAVVVLTGIVKGEVVSAGTALADFGLDAEHVVEVVLTDETGAIGRIRLGNRSPKRGYWFAQDEEGTVLAIKGDFDFAHNEIDDWRDWRVFNFNPALVTTFTLSSPGGILTVAEQSVGHWEVMDFGEADVDAVEETIVGLLQMRYRSQLEVTDGIADVQTRAVIGFEDGTELKLQVGPIFGAGRLVRRESGETGVVAEQELAFLGQGPTDFGISRERAMDVLGLRLKQQSSENK